MDPRDFAKPLYLTGETQRSASPIALCHYSWRDGWGIHQCTAVKDHEKDHRCYCDATERQEKKES